MDGRLARFHNHVALDIGAGIAVSVAIHTYNYNDGGVAHKEPQL